MLVSPLITYMGWCGVGWGRVGSGGVGGLLTFCNYVVDSFDTTCYYIVILVFKIQLLLHPLMFDVCSTTCNCVAIVFSTMLPTLKHNLQLRC